MLLLVYYGIASAERTSRSYYPVSFSRGWRRRRRRRRRRQRKRERQLRAAFHSCAYRMALCNDATATAAYRNIPCLALPYCLFCIQVNQVKMKVFLCSVCEGGGCLHLKTAEFWENIDVSFHSLMNDSIDETWKWATRNNIVTETVKWNCNCRAEFGYLKKATPNVLMVAVCWNNKYRMAYAHNSGVCYLFICIYFSLRE